MTHHPEKPPFQDHRRYYLFVKIAVVLIAAHPRRALFPKPVDDALS